MSIKFALLRKDRPKSPSVFAQVEGHGAQLLEYLRQPAVQDQIKEVHQLGESSARVQAVVMPGAEALGFVSEKKGLFANYRVPALRPDYFAKVDNTGILLEVERGKTTANNMDLLDLWKCHICEHADFLFLLVPQRRVSANGSAQQIFKQVQSRLSTFYVPKNYVDVEAVFLFGY